MRGWATRGLPPRTHLQCIRCAGLPRIGRVAGFPHEETHKLLTCHRLKQNTMGHAIGNTISVNVLMRLLPRLLVVAAARLVQPAVAARSDPWKSLTKTQLRSMETLPDDL